MMAVDEALSDRDTDQSIEPVRVKWKRSTSSGTKELAKKVVRHWCLGIPTAATIPTQVHEIERPAADFPGPDVASVIGSAPDGRVSEIKPVLFAEPIEGFCVEGARTTVEDQTFRRLCRHLG